MIPRSSIIIFCLFIGMLPSRGMTDSTVVTETFTDEAEILTSVTDDIPTDVDLENFTSLVYDTPTVSDGVESEETATTTLSQSEDTTTDQSEDSSTTPKQPEDTTTTPKQPEDSSTTPIQSEDTTTTPKQPEDSSTTPKQPEDTSTTPKQPEASSTTPIQSEDTTTTRKQSEDITTTPKQPEDTTTTPKQPEDSSTTPKQPEDTTTTPKQPEDTTTTPKQSEDSSTAPKQPEDTTTTPKQSEDSSTAPKQPEDTTTTPKQPEDSSTTPQQPENTTTTPKQPEDTTTTPQQPEDTSTTPKQGSSTLSSESNQTRGTDFPDDSSSTVGTVVAGSPSTEGISPTTVTSTTGVMPTTTVTPTTTPPESFPPDGIDELSYDIGMQLLFDQPFDSQLNDDTSAMFQTLSAEVESQVKGTIAMSPGKPFKPTLRDVEVVSFIDGPEDATISSLRHIASTGTIVNYRLLYPIESVTEEDIRTLISFINGTVIEELKEVTINNTDTNDDFLDQQARAVLQQSGDDLLVSIKQPCTLFNEPCRAGCARCLNQWIGSSPMTCSPQCLESEHKVCSSDDGEAISCTCMKGFVDMAGSCTDQTIIIGVFSGVGGALVIGLIIGLVVMAVRQRSVKHKSGYESPASTHPIFGYGAHGSEGDNPGFSELENEMDKSVTKRSTTNSDNPNGNIYINELQTFGWTQNDSRPEPDSHKRESSFRQENENAKGAMENIQIDRQTALMSVDPQKDYFANRPKINLKENSAETGEGTSRPPASFFSDHQNHADERL